jgi:ribonuclease HI/probable phosphoglycerate mutase
MSNNVAEYSALKRLLELFIKKGKNTSQIIVRGDSQLVIKQMWGTWAMNGGLYIKTALECRDLLKQFPAISGEWVPREKNALADYLSKDALRKAGVKITERRK